MTDREDFEAEVVDVAERLVPAYSPGPLGDEMRRMAEEIQARLRNKVLYGTDDPEEVERRKQRIAERDQVAAYQKRNHK